MDKETLSHYGWIVILVLILSVMMALATPFFVSFTSLIKSTSTSCCGFVEMLSLLQAAFSTITTKPKEIKD